MSLYNKIFARIYDPFMASAERRKLGAWRQRLLGSLEGRILEVGAGTGANFPYYPGCAEVLAIDPSEEMLAFAKRKQASETARADIRLMPVGIGDPRLDALVRPRSLDAIVATLVLCTVPEPEEAFVRFRKWLKPSGKLLVLEHIHAKTAWRRGLEKAINPLWKVLAEGCHLTRDTDLLLRNAGFEPLQQDYFKLGVNWYAAELKLS